MKYALGNMLNGAGGLNADGLSLDLQFATDKTLTARKGPTPTFTRASNATVVGSDGLVQLAGSNVALYSGAIVNGTGWAASETTSVVSGIGIDGNNAYLITETTATSTHNIANTGGSGTTGATSVVIGTTYTGSIFVKKVDGSVDWIQMSLGGAGFGSSQYANFDIGSGTVGNSSGLASGTLPKIENYGNGWYRCSISVTASATTSISANIIFSLINNTNGTTRVPSYTGSTANKVLAAMCQFQQGTVATTYLPTTTAAVYAPRFDHDPVTLACKGLLVEESRTNVCVNSNLLTSASWIANATTVASDAAGPDGTTAYEISETTANSTHSFVNSGANTSTPSTVITTGVAYTQSIFLKKSVGSVDWVQLTFTGAAFVAGQYANFNLNTGVVGNLSGVTSRIEQFPNGWYRCSITATATASVTNGNAVIVQFTNNTNTTVRGLSYTGSTANKILVAMGQLEAGAFPTSYIPTTTGTLARSADVCSITGAGFTGMWNNLEGTLLINAGTPASGDRTVVAVDDNTANEMIRLRTEATNPFFKVTDGGSEVVTIDAGAIVSNTAFKLAGAYKLNDFAASINGGAAVTDSVGTTPTVDRMRIGAGQSGNTMCGCVASLRYFKKRLLDAKLQTLTV